MCFVANTEVVVYHLCYGCFPQIIVKKNMDQMKLRIFLSQLRSGKYIIRKRPN